MADDFESRLGKLEGDFHEYVPMLYGYIDELRTWTKELRVEHIDSRKRIEQNERLIQDVVEMQGSIIRLLDKMDDKLDDHNDRLNSAGL